MNSWIEQLNAWGAQAQGVAWAMLWQSSLLIALLLAIDLIFGRKLRPGIRYAFWLVVLVKLSLPPSLALPTSVAWWVRPSPPKPAPAFHPMVPYGPTIAGTPSVPVTPVELPRPSLSLAGAAILAGATISLALLGFSIWRCCQAARKAGAKRGSEPPRWLHELLDEARAAVRLRRRVTLRLVVHPMSPALFGLFKPVLLLPESLTRRLEPPQLKAVLLHELLHLKRHDVWLNCAQALLQVLYWWHPLVWLANSRIRRAREEAVDEAVMLALRGDAESYAPTLLEVARWALPRPLATLGLVGILESRSALRQRIERLADFHPPRRAGVTLISVVCAAAFGALALPMGQAPEPEPPVGGGLAGGQETNGISITASEASRAAASKLVQDGKLLFEMGKLDEAQKKLAEALQQNIREQAAYYYLDLIKQARARQQPGLRNVTPGRPLSSGRQRLYRKLEDIRLEFVAFANVPLREAVKTLADESRLRDPDGSGVNLIISQSPLPDNSSTLRDIENTTVTIQPQLTNLRLADALDAVVKTASRPIKYSLEDYGVVFSLKATNEPVPLYTRNFRVDANTFGRVLRLALGRPDEPAGSANTFKLFKEFLGSIGVDLNPPKAIFLSEHGGLLVRSSLQDLDIIEAAVQALNIAPPQLVIKARFVELSETETATFWQQQRSAMRAPSGALLLQLHGEEAHQQLENWRSQGADLLAESSIVTLSGRQCQIQVMQLTNVVTFTNSPAGQWLTNEVAVGPWLDVTPTVSADTFRTDLALVASVNDFLGYKAREQGGPPIPDFRARKLAVTTTVWDGDTLAIGGFPEEENRPPGSTGRKLLVVFVTPTLIDPVGNRLHSAEQIENARQRGTSWEGDFPPVPLR